MRSVFESFYLLNIQNFIKLQQLLGFHIFPVFRKRRAIHMSFPQKACYRDSYQVFNKYNNCLLYSTLVVSLVEELIIGISGKKKLVLPNFLYFMTNFSQYIDKQQSIVFQFSVIDILQPYTLRRKCDIWQVFAEHHMIKLDSDWFIQTVCRWRQEQYISFSDNIDLFISMYMYVCNYIVNETLLNKFSIEVSGATNKA